MMLTNFLPRAALVLALVATAVAGVQSYRLQVERMAHAEDKAEWSTRLADINQAIADELVRGRAKEKTLTDAAAQTRKVKDDEIRTLTLRHAAVVDSLRNRPDSPGAGGADLSTPAAAGPTPDWCTGARLYRDHAAAFAGEAALAAELQAHLRACVGQYEALEIR